MRSPEGNRVHLWIQLSGERGKRHLSLRNELTPDSLQIVIVVEAERTTRSDVRESIERLGTLPETAVGFVLNKTRHEMDPGYYGYGYGSGYGY